MLHGQNDFRVRYATDIRDMRHVFEPEISLLVVEKLLKLKFIGETFKTPHPILIPSLRNSVSPAK